METPSLSPEVREFLVSLNDQGVSYLIIGGVAVTAHGHVRATKDMDVWVRRKTENAQRILRAIKQFAGSTKGIDTETFTSPRKMFFMGQEPNRVDVVNDIDGVEYDACSDNAINTVLDGVPVRVIGLDDLIVNKRASGRPQDLADVIKLEDIRDHL